MRDEQQTTMVRRKEVASCDGHGHSDYLIIRTSDTSHHGIPGFLPSISRPSHHHYRHSRYTPASRDPRFTAAT